MPTVQEILIQSGLTPEQIAALDAKALTAFTGVLSTAEQERKQAQEAAAAAKAAQDAAELAQRANKEFYDQTIVPSLTGWETQEQALKAEIANAKALAAYYETQNKTARESGFIAADAPLFNPAAVAAPGRDPQGKFVAGAQGGTPGSPSFKMEEFENRLGNGLDNGFWAVQEYQRLSGGQFLPDSVSKLAEEATANKLPFRDYVARKYDFASKQAALQAKAKEEERAKWVAEATAPLQEKIKQTENEWQKKLEEKVKEVSERGGNNPDVRRAAISNYPEVKKAVEQGTRKDPLSMTREERQVEMRRQIQADVAVNEESKQGAAA
jgi:type II secretory pathway pseudopilin PulG